MAIRRFGIELELVAPIGRDPGRFSIETVAATGIEIRANSHFGTDYSIWQAKPDSSLSPAGRCIEVVSRFMQADESAYVEIRRAVRALQVAGFGINRTCGFHVHINCSDMTPAQRLMVAIRYNNIQDDINAMLPPSRRSNGFCSQPSPHEISAMVGDITRGTASGHRPADRYRPVNLAYMNSRGSLEFRQAAGTCDPDKVLGWIKFLQDMVEEVKRGTDGIVFAARPAPAPRPSRPASVVTTTRPTSRPRLREGSHAYLVMRQLCAFGHASGAWAAEQAILPHVFRSIVTGFRRHGARIETDSSAAGLTYRLPLDLVRAVPITEAQLFSGTPREVSAPVAVTPAPAAPPRSADVIATLRYDFFAGLSEESRAWVMQRRAVMSEDMTDHAVRAA